MVNLDHIDHVFRKDYEKGTLSELDVLSDPLDQFKVWFDEFVLAKATQPNSMILSTVGSTGVPHSRVVLLKHVDEEGFVFFTNYTSQKAEDMAFNSCVSLLFFSIELERQIHISGHVKKVSYDASNVYFKSRPFDSQIAAIASRQSQRVESRHYLERSFSHLKKTYEQSLPECPEYWGGYCVVPEAYEFWQGRPSRLHDRICYEKKGDVWNLFRKAP